nr:MAG TPA: hypothetical protein [Caudoviricetes sp.]
MFLNVRNLKSIYFLNLTQNSKNFLNLRFL